MVVRSRQSFGLIDTFPAQKRTGRKEFLIITFKYDSQDLHLGAFGGNELP